MTRRLHGGGNFAILAPMGWYVESPEGVIVTVRVQPRSSRAGVDGLSGDALKVRVRSAPVDGKANQELVETLADAFRIAKSAVVFKGGETSRNKRILLKGVSVSAAKGIVEP
ncbi:MAG: DUF167 domain-containing protein [Kiritimatiellia bacterium]|jgi:uncharacterized protein (TIGR00251 family)